MDANHAPTYSVEIPRFCTRSRGKLWRDMDTENRAFYIDYSEIEYMAIYSMQSNRFSGHS